MAKGTKAIRSWDHWGAQLKFKQTRFRMSKRPNKPFIQTRELENGKVVREFSSGAYKPEIDEDIAACAAQCIAASQGKGWEVTAKVTVKSWLTWELLAQSALLPAEQKDLATDPHTGSVRRVVAQPQRRPQTPSRTIKGWFR